ncbi:isoprenyl transferase [bacterium]|nr:isoprenyl transferase [bacterium]
MSFKENINTESLPEHIAIIMDGNGRWAKENSKPRVFGHTKGVVSVRDVVEGAGEIGLKYMTLYAFSTENWNRPKTEVTALMQLLVSTISKEVNKLHKSNVRLLTIGDLASLPGNCSNELEKAVEKTKDNTGLSLVLALSYSSKWEIVNAVKEIALDVKSDKIDVDSINAGTFENYLSTANIPTPELLIRTSGEYRLSNFLLWQLAYAELYFTKTLWPDFRKENLFEAIVDFQQRERRYGLTSEQLSK